MNVLIPTFTVSMNVLTYTLTVSMNVLTPTFSVSMDLLYYFSLAMGGRMVVTTDLYKDCLQHARGWSHEASKNVLNANKMTDTVNYVFRRTYVIQMFTKH